MPSPSSHSAASEDHAHLLLDRFPAIGWTVDRELRITSWTGRGLEDLGYGKSELVGQSIGEFHGTQDPAHPALKRHRQSLDGEGGSYEVTVMGRCFRAHVQPLRGEDDDIIGCVGVALDVTERARAEERTRFRGALLNQVENAVIATDLDGRVTYWNRHATALYGWTAQEAYGRPILEVNVPVEGESLAREIMTTVAQEGVWRGEFETRRRDGSTFPVHTTLSIVRDEGGRPMGFGGISYDVSDERAAAAAVGREVAFRRGLGALLEESLQAGLDESFYQDVIDAAVRIVPGAEAGTVLLLHPDGRFRAVATCGFDLSRFGGVSFAPEEWPETEDGAPTVSRDHTSLFEKDADRYQELQAAGPVDRIRVTISCPVRVRGVTIAHFHLDNLSDPHAFGREALEMTRVFATQVAALLHRFELERDLANEREALERSLHAYKALARFGEEIEIIHDVDELVDHGMARMLEKLGFDVAIFTDLREDGIHPGRILGRVDPLLEVALGRPTPYRTGINGRVVLDGEPIYVEDYGRFEHALDEYVQAEVGSILALPVRRGGRVRHTLSFATVRRTKRVDDDALRIVGGFVRRLENAFERAQQLGEIEATREATFRALGLALEYRDYETRGHTDRVVELSTAFARVMGLNDVQRRALQWGAYLHDLGKIAVPDQILLKPGRLTEAEFDVIRRHTVSGNEMTRGIPFLPTETRQVIRSHHERWDGTGYPDALAGNEIPILARMFALVDVYDALTSERPYKRAWSRDEALAELEASAGTHFDPALLPPFLKALSQVERTRAGDGGDSASGDQEPASPGTESGADSRQD